MRKKFLFLLLTMFCGYFLAPPLANAYQWEFYVYDVNDTDHGISAGTYTEVTYKNPVTTYWEQVAFCDKLGDEGKTAYSGIMRDQSVMVGQTVALENWSSSTTSGSGGWKFTGMQAGNTYVWQFDDTSSKVRVMPVYNLYVDANNDTKYNFKASLTPDADGVYRMTDYVTIPAGAYFIFGQKYFNGSEEKKWDDIAACFQPVGGDYNVTTSVRSASIGSNGAWHATEDIRVKISINTSDNTLHFEFDNHQTVPMPVFDPDGGVINESTVVTISCPGAPAGTIIRYTTDGTTIPTTSSGTQIKGSTGTVTISASKTLMAIAYCVGFEPSPVATAVFTYVEMNDYTIFAKNEAGWDNVAIHLWEWDGQPADFYGTLVDPVNKIYMFKFRAPSNANLMFRATLENWDDNNKSAENLALVDKALYTIKAGSGVKPLEKKDGYSVKCAAPVFSPVDGYTFVGESLSVSLTCPIEGATIMYRIDNSNNVATKGTTYDGPFEIQEGCTIYAVAVLDGLTNSDVVSATYRQEYEPTNYTVYAKIPSTWTGVVFQNFQSGLEAATLSNVTAELLDAGERIYKFSFSGVSGLMGRFKQTADGATPKTADFTIQDKRLYTISGNIEGDINTYQVSNGEYTYKPTCATPVFTVNGASGSSFNISRETQVTISTTTPNARISYRYKDGDNEVSASSYGTTDASGTRVTITVPAITTTIYARAFRDDYNYSAEANARFTYIDPSTKLYYLAQEAGGYQTLSKFLFTWSEADQAYSLVLKTGTGFDGFCKIVRTVGDDVTYFGHEKVNNGGSNFNLTVGAHADLVSGQEPLYAYEVKTKAIKIILVEDDNDATIHLKVEEYEAATVANLPLSYRDFANGPKYFIVGARMGAWHLQPEWMFKDVNGTLTLPGRFVYPGNFAVARVRSYEDYAKQIYDILWTNSNVQGSGDTSTITKTLDNAVHGFNAGASSQPTNVATWDSQAGGKLKYAMWFEYGGDGTKDENGTDQTDTSKYGIGTWCETITLNVDGDSPVLTFNIKNDQDTRAKHRVFQLVGDKIYHTTYSNGATVKYNGRDIKLATKRGESAGNGWQEGYIQFDANNRPYFDAYGHYLYFTEYSDKTFTDASMSLFRMDMGDGEYRDFDSESITFKEAEIEGYTDDTTDPYREYYKHFTGRKVKIQNGVVENTDLDPNSDTYYKFNITGIESPVEANDWHCYVVKDVWMDGEFKFWTGWGGNSMAVENAAGGDADGARWNRMNGGAATNSGYALDDVAGDIFGSNVANDLPTVLNYMDKGAGSDYKLSGLTYFNRVILWYSPTKGFQNSFLQFIQEKASPAIEASLQKGSNNKAKYTWKLINTTGSTGVQLKKYAIKRYIMDDGTLQESDDKESGNFPADYTVGNFLTDNPNGKTTLDDDELSAGIYYYQVTLTFADGSVKKVLSNPVYVYDGAAIASPMCAITQMVRLEEKGFNALKDYMRPESKFDDTYKRVYCLTYRQNPTADTKYYLMSASINYSDLYAGNDGFDISDFKEIPGSVYRSVMDDPEQFTWTAYFFVRALDYDNWLTKVEQGVRAYSFAEANLKSLTVTDANTVTTASPKGREVNVDVNPISIDGHQYLAAFIDREGSLRTNNFTVNMTWEVKADESGSFDTYGPATAVSRVRPEIAKPLYMGYTYMYRFDKGNPITDAMNAAEGSPYGTVTPDKVNVKMQTRDSQNNVHEVFVKEADMVGARHLDCVFQFDRPNVSAAIFAKYDIYYDVEFSTEIVETPSGIADAHEDIEVTDYNYDNGWYIDKKVTDTNYGEAPYNLTVTDVHPYAYAVPHFKINSTEYRRNNTSDPDRVLVANFGKDIDVIAKQAPKREFTMGMIRLGVNHDHSERVRDEVTGKWKFVEYGPWTWSLVGHTDFAKDPSVDFNDDGDHSSEMKDMPSLFQVEIKADYATNATDVNIIKHDPEHTGMVNVKTGNDMWHYTMPYAGATAPAQVLGVIGTTESTCQTPSVRFTPVYTFVRNPQSLTEFPQHANITDLEKVVTTPANARRRAASAPEAPQAGETPVEADGPVAGNSSFTPNFDNLTKNEDGTYTYDGTADGDVVLYRGSSDTVPGNSNNVMTGIESVTIDSTNGTPEYYNLQGIRVANPEHGQFYIKKIGNTSTKIRY